MIGANLIVIHQGSASQDAALRQRILPVAVALFNEKNVTDAFEWEVSAIRRLLYKLYDLFGI